MSDTPNSTGGRLLDKYAGPLVAHLLLIGLWQVVASLPSMPTYILPSPLETLATLGDEGNDWIANTAVTATDEPYPAQASPCGASRGAGGASSISQACCSGSG